MVLTVRDTLEQVREKIEAGERLDFEDGVALMESDDLLGLGDLADLARRLRGGSTEGALVRVAETSALRRSREMALDYAGKARGFLDGQPELEALTHIVIDRER